MSATEALVQTVLAALPEAQAIYLFGSWGTEYQRPDSDVDIAVLLPPAHAKALGNLTLHPLVAQLATILQRDIDLINLRQVATVFQKEIVLAERRLYCADTFAADEFEMLVLSYYEKLSEERAELIREGLHSGRFYQP